MRYNPPPTWPQPPAGWSPPPGWTPDPAWGPPPPGWPLWVDDGAPAGPGYGPVTAGPPGGGRRGTPAALVAGGVVLVLLVAVGGFLLLRSPSDEPVTVTAGGASTSAGATTGSGAGTAADPKALGAPSTVGDYEATLTRVEPDGTAAVLAENQFNDPPENDRYVLVDLEATYTGTGSGSALFDLYVTLQGSDGEEYHDYDCSAVVPDDLSGKDDLAPGQTGTGSLCFDVPAGALDGATMSLSLSGGEEEVFYRTS